MRDVMLLLQYMLKWYKNAISINRHNINVSLNMNAIPINGYDVNVSVNVEVTLNANKYL